MTNFEIFQEEMKVFLEVFENMTIINENIHIRHDTVRISPLEHRRLFFGHFLVAPATTNSSIDFASIFFDDFKSCIEFIKLLAPHDIVSRLDVVAEQTISSTLCRKIVWLRQIKSIYRQMFVNGIRPSLSDLRQTCVRLFSKAGQWSSIVNPIVEPHVVATWGRNLLRPNLQTGVPELITLFDNLQIFKSDSDIVLFIEGPLLNARIPA